MTGDNSRFMPIRGKHKVQLDTIGHSLNFICLNSSEMHLHGQVGSKKGRLLHMGVVRCAGKDYCKS